jgi:hypothetical protein
MAYTDKNYKNKKDMKADVLAGKEVTVYQPGPFGPSVSDGECSIEGPHYPQPHKWYARVRVQGGKITKVLG